MFEKLINGSSTADRKAAAQEVTEQMLSGGAASFKVCVGSLCHTLCMSSRFYAYALVYMLMLSCVMLLLTLVSALQADGIVDKVKVAAEHKNAEGGLLAVKALAETKHSAAEAYVVAMLPILMDKYADKVLDCQFN